MNYEHNLPDFSITREENGFTLCIRNDEITHTNSSRNRRLVFNNPDDLCNTLRRELAPVDETKAMLDKVQHVDPRPTLEDAAAVKMRDDYYAAQASMDAATRRQAEEKKRTEARLKEATFEGYAGDIC